MKKVGFLLLAPVLLLVGVGAWFRAFPAPMAPEPEGPLRAVLMFRRSLPLTKQEKWERNDTKISFQFAMRGVPDLPRGFSYKPAAQSSSAPIPTDVTYNLRAQNYRLVTLKNGIKKAHGQNGYGVLQGFTYNSGHLLNGTVVAKAYLAPSDSDNFIVFDLIAESSNPRVPQPKSMGVYALDLKSHNLLKWS